MSSLAVPDHELELSNIIDGILEMLKAISPSENAIFSIFVNVRL